MKYIAFLSLITLIIFTDSCKSQKMEKLLAETNTKVMALHDETMAKHGEIMALSDQLRKKANDTTLKNITALDSIRTELDGVNEDMMDWMTHFSEPTTKDDAAIKYLSDQAQLLQKMKENQDKNILAAKELLK